MYKRFRNSVKVARVYRSADTGSDHYLVITTIKLRLKKHQSKKSSRVKYDTAKLENQDYLKAFTISLKKKYQVLGNRAPAKENNEEVERDSMIMKKACTETTKEVLGRPRKKKKPWISIELWNMIDQREEINKRI